MESSEDLDCTEVEYKETNSYYDLLKDVDKSDEIKEICNYEKQYNECDDKDGAQEISDLTGIALGVMMLEEIKKGIIYEDNLTMEEESNEETKGNSINETKSHKPQNEKELVEDEANNTKNLPKTDNYQLILLLVSLRIIFKIIPLIYLLLELFENLYQNVESKLYQFYLRKERTSEIYPKDTEETNDFLHANKQSDEKTIDYEQTNIVSNKLRIYNYNYGELVFDEKSKFKSLIFEFKNDIYLAVMSTKANFYKI